MMRPEEPQQTDSSVALSSVIKGWVKIFENRISNFESLDLVGEHCVESEGRPRGLLNTTQETLPA
jgi:hypothetical protein